MQWQYRTGSHINYLTLFLYSYNFGCNEQCAYRKSEVNRKHLPLKWKTTCSTFGLAILSPTDQILRLRYQEQGQPKLQVNSLWTGI